MALVLNDRVKETSTTTGQGTLSLAGAATGFETFVTGIGDGNTTYYLAAHESDGTWELGIGTVTDASPDTLARTTVIDTSAGNTTKIDFAAGNKTIFCTLPASKAVFLDADGDVTLGANLDVGGNLVVTGTTTFNGGTLTLGDANTDNIVFGGEVDSNIIPDDDDTHDLGSSSKEWKDIYIDGVAYLDSINFNGTAISSTAAELNILDGVTSTTSELNILDGVTATTAELNIMDGNTSASSTTLADEDRVVVNDANTMKQVALTDFETYFESALDTLSNVTTVGTLNSGSISSGFGAIDIGSSNLTSTGTISLGATSFNDNNITNVGNIAVDSISADATDINLAVTDNSATAFTIKQGSDAYFVVDTADSSESVSIGTGISGTAITLGHSTSEVTVADNLTVTGDLTVSGTTTTVNSTTVNLNDHNIVLDSGNSTSAVINGSGITIEGGSGDDATFTYNTTGPKFELKLGSSHEDLQVDQLIAASLDISGNVDVDGTLETDALSINGTSVTSTAAELNILDGVTATATELNLLDGGTSVGSSITLADGDGIVTNDDGTMKTIPASDIKTYVGAAAGAFSIANLDIDGGSDIGADLVGDDLIIVDDNAGGTNRKATLTRLMTFVNANSSSAAPAADDIQAGDAAVTLTTTSGNITIDAQANDSDIIFKGTDGSSDTTFLTLDGSDAGKAIFNGDITAGDNVGLKLGASLDLQLYHNTNSFIENYTGNLIIDAAADDSDIIFKGTDGGVDTTYLTIDGSDAGTATFNHKVGIGTNAPDQLLHVNKDQNTDTAIRVKNNTAGTAARASIFLDANSGGGQILALSGSFTTSGNYVQDSLAVFADTSMSNGMYIGARAASSSLKLIAADAIQASVTGDGIKFADNKKALFGDSNDLQIFHDGSHSVVQDDGTGHLQLSGSQVTITKADRSASLAEFVDGGANKFYHNGTNMASTTSVGFQVEADKRFEIVNGSNWSGEQAGKIEHHSNNMYHQFTTSWIVRNSSGSDIFTIDSSGNGVFNANVTAFSDLRLKEDIKTIDNALDKVSKLRGVEYTRKETKAREIGVIAQEVKEVVPELVTIKNLRSDINPDALEDMHTMKYQNTVGLLIEAIKELKAEMKELKKG